MGAWSSCSAFQGLVVFPAEVKPQGLSPWPRGGGAAVGSTAKHSPYHPDTHGHLQAPKSVTVR